MQISLPNFGKWLPTTESLNNRVQKWEKTPYVGSCFTILEIQSSHCGVVKTAKATGILACTLIQKIGNGCYHLTALIRWLWNRIVANPYHFVRERYFSRPPTPITKNEETKFTDLSKKEEITSDSSSDEEIIDFNNTALKMEEHDCDDCSDSDSDDKVIGFSAPNKTT